MLGCNADPKLLRFPAIASPKLDGIRGLVHDDMLLSRSLKRIPNIFIHTALERAELEGFDGELIVGPPNVPTTYNTSVRGIMSRDGEPEFQYHVFDLLPPSVAPLAPYGTRYEVLEKRVKKLPKVLQPFVKILDQVIVNNLDELTEFESMVISQGFEGVILRDPGSPYKFGRSTVAEGYLLKVKRFSDSEAEIIGFEEQLHNGNEAKTNELGRTKRSSHKANLEPMGTLGALLVRDVNTNVEFSVGTGIDAETRQYMWDARELLLHRTIKYKFFPVGVKDKPRHPVFIGMRDPRDM